MSPKEQLKQKGEGMITMWFYLFSVISIFSAGYCLWIHDLFAGVGYTSASVAWFIIGIIREDDET